MVMFFFGDTPRIWVLVDVVQICWLEFAAETCAAAGVESGVGGAGVLEDGLVSERESFCIAGEGS